MTSWQVFADDKPPVVGVIPLEQGLKGVLFNREKKVRCYTASMENFAFFSCSNFLFLNLRRLIGTWVNRPDVIQIYAE